MRIIERYIINIFIPTLLGCLAIFFFLYIIIDIFSHLDEIVAKKALIDSLINYYLALLPVIFIQTCPVAALLSTLYTLGTLSMHNELIAMRNAGLSIFRITRPLILVGVALSSATLWMNESVMPYTLKNQEYYKQMIFGEEKKKEESENKPIKNLAFYGKKNRLFFINEFNIAKTEMNGIVILQQDMHQNLIKKIVADKGKWEYDSWRFYRCYTYNFSNGQIADDPNYMEAIKTDINESPEEMIKQKHQVAVMDIFELLEYIQRLRYSGAEETVRGLRVDLYNKLFSPFVSLIIILCGIPFAISTKRKAGFFGSMGICIFISFVYYGSSAFSLALGKAGILPPLISTLSAHLFFLSMGIILIKKHR